MQKNHNSNEGKTSKLAFIHHSCGENWLSDENGGLGIALMKNGFFVSDTYYGWGPDNVGDRTDIGNWWEWFLGPDSSRYLEALYAQSGQCSSYSRFVDDPGGENTVIMFKSCYPNSLFKSGNGQIPDIKDNPLKGNPFNTEHHTVENAMGIYIALLEYFKSRQDKLFIVVTAPPVLGVTYAANARKFNNWLVKEWLKDYPYKNVAVFDFYDVLTEGDVFAYPSSQEDDHPSVEGNLKATMIFVPFIKEIYERFKQG